MLNCEGCDARIDAWMIYCHECGEFQMGEDESDTDCNGCGRGISLHFGFCPYCGEDTGEPPSSNLDMEVDDFQMDRVCQDKGCEKQVTCKMLFCISCGSHQNHHDDFDDECGNCHTGADSAWGHCVWCGAYGLMEKEDDLVTGLRIA